VFSVRLIWLWPSVAEFMNDEDWQRQRENRDYLTYFLNEAWKMAVAKRLAAYDMSGNRIAFYFDKKSLPDPDVRFVGVSGKATRRGLMGYKTVSKGKRQWHFGVSGKAAVHPRPMVMLRSHVLFFITIVADPADEDDRRNVNPRSSPLMSVRCPGRGRGLSVREERLWKGDGTGRDERGVDGAEEIRVSIDADEACAFAEGVEERRDLRPAN